MNSDSPENMGLKLHHRLFNLGKKAAKVLDSFLRKGRVLGRVKDGCTLGSWHTWIPRGDS